MQLRKWAWLHSPPPVSPSVGLAATELWRVITEGKREKEGIEAFFSESLVFLVEDGLLCHYLILLSGLQNNYWNPFNKLQSFWESETICAQ